MGTNNGAQARQAAQDPQIGSVVGRIWGVEAHGQAVGGQAGGLQEPAHPAALGLFGGQRRGLVVAPDAVLKIEAYNAVGRHNGLVVGRKAAPLKPGKVVGTKGFHSGWWNG